MQLERNQRFFMMTTRSIFLAFCTICSQMTGAQGGVDSDTVPLAGQWRFALDAADVGISEAWYGRILKDTIQLPGVLQTDPGEMTDLATDPNYRQILLEHRELLARYGRDYHDAEVADMLADDVKPIPFKVENKPAPKE